MKQKIIFQSKKEADLFNFLESDKERTVFNFLNLHDLYQANKIPIFKKSILEEQNINFIDGFIISVYLSLLNFKKVPRRSGPFSTKLILSNPRISSSKKHFFIGLEKEDIRSLQRKYPHLKNVRSYNPPYIKNINFNKKEIEKIAKLINKKKIDCVWISIGCPKQNILASELFPRTNAKYFMNVGAAIDFLLGKKKQAPRVIRNLGMEWLYRLITDFKYSRKKVWRSFLGLSKLNQITLAKNNSNQ